MYPDQLIKSYTIKTEYNRNRPVNVLHIIKSLGRGGAETLLSETLHEHNKDNFNFHYIYFLPWKDQMVKEIEKEGGKVICLSSRNNVEIFFKIKRIVRYIWDNQIHVIHCHMPFSGLVARIAGKISRVPVVYTEHNKWERYHWITYWLNRLSFSQQKNVIAVSAEVERSIKLHYKNEVPLVQIVANGVNTKKFSVNNTFGHDVRHELNIPSNATVIGTISVFRSQKRITAWLEIAASLYASRPDLAFIIVGDGVLKDEIKKKAAELKTEGYVHFVGLQNEVRPYLKAMDIFMMCSEFEGLPVALLEAMSMECLPACTGAGGIPEVIHDGINGVLVPVDQPLQLAGRIIECLQFPEEFKKMREEARKSVVQSFGLKKMVRRIETIYNATLKNELIN